ncbi:HSP20-like chaperone [Syncephalastrum racemosum]|uniref:HSP20-like chaperone n=1 Tax=Syncephalastrum racemosum TaxID=13706 RepID=A0A1X2HNP0_SYNRA|nr:HSP20-like chaperone [Syncephalastrum racemosum]
MSLTNWSGADRFDHLERRMTNLVNSLFDSTRGGISNLGSRNGNDQLAERFQADRLVPAVEVQENEASFLISAEMPGVKKEDISVDVHHNNTLTFSAHTQVSKDRKEDNIHYTERRFGQFSRTVPIPENVDADNIDAKYENGVLRLTMPKKENKKASKRITVA